MARKVKRKIVVYDRLFYWFVAEDLEDAAWLGAETTLTIFSDDERFCIKYPFEQRRGINHLVVVGKEFEGRGVFGKIYKRVASPVWEESKTITPGKIREIIEWCLTPKDCKYVGYQGNHIE